MPSRFTHFIPASKLVGLNREEQSNLLEEAGRAYDPERHDPDSIFFDDSYTGPSERELMGGCNRCGGLDDCYCD